jgi:cyclohexa-1,5-dienecarbonyl-CoA hydratase
MAGSTYEPVGKAESARNIMSVRVSLDDGLGRLVVDHPPLNILTREVLANLLAGIRKLEGEPSLRAVLLSAEGEHFSVGADVGEHLPPKHEDLIPEFMDTVAAIATFPLPVVAAVQGRCLGGGFEVAMAADVLVAGESASFGQPEIMLGVLPPVACALLPYLCPPGAAAELVLTGEPLSATEAERAGLVRRVVPDGELAEAALELARSITRHSAATLRIGKRMLRGDQSPLRAALSRAGDMYVKELMATEDALEGLHSFQEKRRPEWSHR